MGFREGRHEDSFGRMIWRSRLGVWSDRHFGAQTRS